MKRSSSAEDAENEAGPHIDIRIVDTSVWIRADRKKKSEFQHRLKALVVAGTAHICWPVRVELLIGSKNDERFQTLDEQLSILPHLPITDIAWRESARIGQKLARSGQTVSLVDLLIAAAAIEANMTLWTVDGDFKRVAAVTDLHVDWYGFTD